MDAWHDLHISKHPKLYSQNSAKNCRLIREYIFGAVSILSSMQVSAISVWVWFICLHFGVRFELGDVWRFDLAACSICGRRIFETVPLQYISVQVGSFQKLCSGLLCSFWLHSKHFSASTTSLRLSINGRNERSMTTQNILSLPDKSMQKCLRMEGSRISCQADARVQGSAVPWM